MDMSDEGCNYSHRPNPIAIIRSIFFGQAHYDLGTLLYTIESLPVGFSYPMQVNFRWSFSIILVISKVFFRHVRSPIYIFYE